MTDEEDGRMDKPPGTPLMLPSQLSRRSAFRLVGGHGLRHRHDHSQNSDRGTPHPTNTHTAVRRQDVIRHGGQAHRRNPKPCS